jgi:hypothetical protein
METQEQMVNPHFSVTMTRVFTRIFTRIFTRTFSRNIHK